MYGEFPTFKWYLYNTTRGDILLTHPWSRTRPVPCPHCGKVLVFEKYKAYCCGHSFRTGFGSIAQREPVGRHSGRAGWKTLRLWQP